MITLYYWTTPNGHKISIALEELGVEYRVTPINISKGEQFAPEFLKISPNNRIPAIVDNDNGLAVFESGAILLYLAEKYQRFIPANTEGRFKVLEWLFWQMGGLGPMAGQNHHFNRYATEKIDYAINRYVNETSRLYGVLNKQLAGKDYICGDYSIADMACYPWIVPHKAQSQRLEDFPHLARWFTIMQERPAVVKAYALAEAINNKPAVHDDESRRILFNQTASKN